MKKWFGSLAMALAFAVLLSGTVFAVEQFNPTKHNKGTLGTSNRTWGSAYLKDVYGTTVHTSDPNIVQSVASKDWGDASGTWTLSATEKKAFLIYNQNTSVANWVIVAPAEQRVYTVYNNGAAAGKFKATGAEAGVSIPAYAVYQVMYFQNGPSPDYFAIASSVVVPTAYRQ